MVVELKPKSPKREITKRRIAEASLKLYLDNGYEKTTMSAVAIEAGVSERTMYIYFPSKEYTLRYWLEDNFYERLPDIILAQPAGLSPLEVAQRSVLDLTELRDINHSISIDGLTDSNIALSEHKKAILLQLEVQMTMVLSQLWPDPAIAVGLRRMSMMVIGAMRIALERWRSDGTCHAISGYIREEFSCLPPTIDPTVSASL